MNCTPYVELAFLARFRVYQNQRRGSGESQMTARSSFEITLLSPKCPLSAQAVWNLLKESLDSISSLLQNPREFPDLD